MLPSNRTACGVEGLVLLLLALTACSMSLSQQHQQTLRRWLLCDDCVGGELDAVAAIGARAAPTLVVALLRGPLPDRRENVRRQVAASYARLVRFASPATVGVSESVYVRRFVDNYVAMYQMRTVIALKRIGTARARRGLRQALTLPTRFRADALHVIGDALGAALFRQSLDSQTARPDSFVAVPPRVLVRDSAGSPLRNVRVTFAVDSGGGAVVDSVQRTDANGMAAVGGWRLGPAPGRKTVRAVAAGRAIRFVAIATP